MFTFVSQHTVHLVYGSLRPDIRTVSTFKIISTVSLLKPNAGSGGNAPILILDATQQEEACVVSNVHVVLDRSNQNGKEPLICAIHKAGGGALPFSLLQDVTSFVVEANAGRSDGVAKVSTGSGHEHLLQETFLLQ